MDYCKPMTLKVDAISDIRGMAMACCHVAVTAETTLT